MKIKKDGTIKKQFVYLVTRADGKYCAVYNSTKEQIESYVDEWNERCYKGKISDWFCTYKRIPFWDEK